VATVKLAFSLPALACVFVAVATASDYRGKAQALMPTPKEIGYSQVIEFRPAKRPAAKLAQGWQSGVAAIFAKGTTKAPTEAVATIYLYASGAAARTAWQRACPTCAHVLVKGVRMRYQAGRANGTLSFRNYTVCHNVYASVVTAGSESSSKLANDAGTIAGWVYKRAMGMGMSACT
jgi:hypothetical protein